MKRAVSIFLAALMALLPVRGAVEFDGADDFVDFGSDLLGVGDFSFAAWVKPNSVGEVAGRILDNGRVEFYLGVATTSIGFSSNASTTVNRTATFLDGLWHHIAVTRLASGAASIFFDGVLLGAAGQSSGTPVAGTSNLRIGSNAATSRSFDGQISEAQIYDRALSAAEIAILASSRTKGPKFSGLIHYWPLDDVADGASGDGATFKDRAGAADGTGNDGANGTGLTGKAETFLSYP